MTPALMNAALLLILFVCVAMVLVIPAVKGR